MQGKDTGDAIPSIRKLRRRHATDGMTGVTGDTAGEIGCAHEHRMRAARVLGVTSKVRGMTRRTLAAGGMPTGTALQLTVGGVMTTLTPLWCMDLTCRDKRCSCRGVTTGAVGGIGGGRGVHLYRSAVVVGMTVEIEGMTSLTACACGLSCRITNQGTSGGAMTGLTAECAVGLARGSVRCCSSGGMATHAQGDSVHVMGVAMTIKVGAMTTLAGSAYRLSYGASGQLSRGTVAGIATELAMCLAGRHIRRLRGCSVTIGT